MKTTTKNLDHKMIYLTILIALNISCTNQNTSHQQENSLPIPQLIAHKIVTDTTPLLKFTAGICSILKDRKGNYWFGSYQEGVAFFDGKSFTYYTVKDGLSNNQVRTIQEDLNGHIWFGTGQGVSSYDGEKFISHSSDKDFFGIKPLYNNGWSINNNDLLFNAGHQNGIYKYDGKKLNYLKFPLPENSNLDLSYATTGFSKGKENIWIASYSAVFGFNGNTFTTITDQSLNFFERPEQLHVRSILEDSKGNLWIGNNGIGVLLYNDNSAINFSEKHGLIDKNSSRNGNYSPPGTLEHVFAIGEDKDGNIWFGDRDTGAWKFDGKLMTNYPIDGEFSTPHIWEIYQDSNGELLFAMANGGVYLFNGKSLERKY